MIGSRSTVSPERQPWERLCLGTAQFGLNYGVSNTTGQVPLSEVSRILDRARRAGIDMLDTAELYGEAEQSLGHAESSDFRIVGKIGPLEGPPDSFATEARRRVKASMARLKQDRLHALLLHRPAQLFDGAETQTALLAALEGLKRDGLVSRIGFSAYHPDETERLMALAEWDLVQLPISPIDGRWRARGILSELRARGIEVHVRSVFLQGLLLMDAAHRPTAFAPWRGLLDDWQACVRSHGLSLVQGALALALEQSEADRLVVGVTTAREFDEIVAALRGLPGDLPQVPLTTDEGLLNPSLWKAS